MANKSRKKVDEFSEEIIRKRRKFPVANTILLVLLVLLQIALPLWASLYSAKPQDRIDEYCITVEPRSDGTLDIRYDITWTPLDEDEPLTWIRVGIANPDVQYYPSQLSDTVNNVTLEEDGDYVAVIVTLDHAYYAGETLSISFTLRQGSLLCKDVDGLFYAFVPGWFNATPVDRYVFRWKDSDGLLSSNAPKQEDGWHVWEGSMPCGTYVMMNVRYTEESFEDAEWVNNVPFDDSGVYDQLKEDKAFYLESLARCILILFIFEIIIIDSYVSYSRGRGFLRGHGHHVHVYGYRNPHYIRARDEYNRTHGGGGRSGGGCACACACACAGGGRAGCSQKNTTHFERHLSRQTK